MEKHIASYIRRGFTMSRRAYIAHKRDEHPITHWSKKLAIDSRTLRSMFVYAGMHHTGRHAMRTAFYRMANLDNDIEYKRFFKGFHSIQSGKKKFIKYMADKLQEEVEPLKTTAGPDQKKNKYVAFSEFMKSISFSD